MGTQFVTLLEILSLGSALINWSHILAIHNLVNFRDFKMLLDTLR